MAKTASAKKSKTKIHKIKADTNKKSDKTKKSKVNTEAKTKKTSIETKKIDNKNLKQKKKVNVIIRFIRYIKSSWSELKKVRWSSRKETWQKVLMIIIYSLVIILIVLTFDNLFNYLFKLILGAK